MEYQNIPVACFDTKADAAKYLGMNPSTFRSALSRNNGVLVIEGFKIIEREEILVFKEVIASVQEATEQRDEEATRAAKFEGEVGKEGAWFVGVRAVAVTNGLLTFKGSNKRCAQFIAENSDFKCSPQKLRKALKNGQRCNGFSVTYINA